MKGSLLFSMAALLALFTTLGISGCGREPDPADDRLAETEGAVVGAACSPTHPCGRGEYCEMSCTSASPVNRCVAIPTACTDVVQPVCGCDNNTYANDCLRRQAKVGLKSAGACH